MHCLSRHYNPVDGPGPAPPTSSRSLFRSSFSGLLDPVTVVPEPSPKVSVDTTAADRRATQHYDSYYGTLVCPRILRRPEESPMCTLSVATVVRRYSVSPR